MSTRRVDFWWYLTLAAGVVFGGGAFGFVLLFGHTHELNSPWEPPWGLLIATGHLLILAAGGLSLLAGLPLLNAGSRLEGVAQKALLVAGFALVIGLGVLGVELTMPARLSLIADLGAAFYRDLGFLAVGCGVFLFLLTGISIALGWGRRILALGLSLAAFGASLAAVHLFDGLLLHFGSSPEWLSGGVLLTNTLSALVLGSALFLFLVLFPAWLEGGEIGEEQSALLLPLRRIFASALGALLLFQVVRVSAYLAGWGLDEDRVVTEALVSGALSLNFWLFEVLAGLLLPLALLLLSWRSRTAGPGMLAIGLMFCGHLFSRFDLLTSAQLGAIRHLSPWLLEDSLLTFSPCFPKLAVVIGSVSLFFLLSTLDEKILPPAAGR